MIHIRWPTKEEVGIIAGGAGLILGGYAALRVEEVSTRVDANDYATCRVEGEVKEMMNLGHNSLSGCQKSWRTWDDHDSARLKPTP